MITTTAQNRRVKILVFAEWYEPGYKAGGPIRSCVNFVQHMKADYAIDIFTSDRDLGGISAYENELIDQWVDLEPGLRVFYCSPINLKVKFIRRQIADISPDFIYLNSMFSTGFTILPLLIRRIFRPNAKFVLSPRGMLRSSALQFKAVKKKIFLTAFRLMGFSSHIHFLASDVTELDDVRKHFGDKAHATMIPNFGGAIPSGQNYIIKSAGMLSMIFVGRIHPVKNLDYLLNVLSRTISSIRLTIVGSIEDKNYWSECESLIKKLPANVTVYIAGELPHDAIAELLTTHHMFVLPTQGENFGHAIYEALAAGRPVLISDQTPWRNLQQQHAGWDISLSQPDLFVQAIEEVAGIEQREFDILVNETFNFAKKKSLDTDILPRYKTLFS